MKKIICFFSVLIGLGIILYPHFLELTNERTQVKVLEIAYAKELLNKTICFKKDKELENLSIINAQFEKGSRINSVSKINTDNVNVKNKINQSKKNIEINTAGIIKIGKIDLELPLIEGATKKNLSVAPCILEESSAIGDVGNFSIAGHRSYSYGKQFNRLDEIEIDDEIEILVNGLEYNFIVTEKFVVEPEDVWVLEGNGKDKMITLMTCTPIKVATHRLIIRGILK